MAHGIVKEYHGHIHVKSKPGNTKFDIYLSITDKTEEKDLTNGQLLKSHKNENILLVDDEEAILKMERQMLERLGYQVTSRTSSIEALEVFTSGNLEFLESIKELKTHISTICQNPARILTI